MMYRFPNEYNEICVPAGAREEFLEKEVADLKEELSRKTEMLYAMEAELRKVSEGQTPAVDAVEVVRCCDCKHSKCEQDVAWCNISWGLMGCLDLDDFCCHGERRENNEID